MTFDEYVNHYARTHRIYWGGGVPWRKYKGTLRPLFHPHRTLTLTDGEVKRLLKESKSRVAMWTYDFDCGESEWWWIIAERPYIFDRLPAKTRYYVRHGLKHCHVDFVSGKVVADIGYDCYRSAMRRHTQTESLSEATFKQNMPGYDGDGIHEIWGVFVGGTLAGFATYRIVDDVSSVSLTRFSTQHTSSIIRAMP
jgi:hypothetical protein